MPVTGSMRSVHGEVDAIRVVPQSQVKFRRANNSTRVCSP